MNKVLLCAAILYFALFLPAYPSRVDEFFDNFYITYLKINKVPKECIPIFDFLYSLSKEKTCAIEEFLLEGAGKNEADEAVFLIEEEYYDLVQNFDFELSLLPCKYELSKKEKKLLKKEYNKFISSYKKNCSLKPARKKCRA